MLNVYNWSDYIAPGVIDDFAREYGIKVNYNVFDSNEVLETKMLMGHSNFNVVVPSGSVPATPGHGRRLPEAQQGLLPNLKYVDPEVAREFAVYNAGNEYARGLHVDHLRARLQRGQDPRAHARCAGGLPCA